MLTATATGLAGIAQTAAPGDTVDLALLIAVDISASVNAEDYRRQMAGLAGALRDPAVAKAMQLGRYGKIAVALMLWSGTRGQFLAIPWSIVSNGEDLARLGAAVGAVQRPEDNGATSISAAILKGLGLLSLAPLAGRKVIDVSADGINNIGPSLDVARLQAARSGITVNGLAITHEWRQLRRYLEDHVITGPDAFAVEAKGYSDFGDVMLQKLLREIQMPGTT